MTANRPGRGELFLIEESVEERWRRVEDIRDRIASGTYTVPAVDVAGALVAFFRRDFAPEEAANPES